MRVRRGPKIIGDAGVVADLEELRHPPHVLPFQMWSFWLKRFERSYLDPPTLSDLAFRLSSSVKVIGTDMDWSATCDFPLVIYSNHRPVWYRFRDKWRNSHKFSNPRVFNAHDKGDPIGIFVTAVGFWKLEWCPTRSSKSVTVYAFV